MLKNILIIDDDRDFVSKVIPKMSGCNYVFSVAGTLQRAKFLIETYKYDIILANIKVPGGNSIDLKNEIVRGLKDTQFLFMSNLDSDYNRALDNGEACYYKYEIYNNPNLDNEFHRYNIG